MKHGNQPVWNEQQELQEWHQIFNRAFRDQDEEGYEDEINLGSEGIRSEVDNNIGLRRSTRTKIPNKKYFNPNMVSWDKSVTG